MFLSVVVGGPSRGDGDMALSKRSWFERESKLVFTLLRVGLSDGGVNNVLGTTTHTTFRALKPIQGRLAISGANQAMPPSDQGLTEEVGVEIEV